MISLEKRRAVFKYIVCLKLLFIVKTPDVSKIVNMRGARMDIKRDKYLKV